MTGRLLTSFIYSLISFACCRALSSTTSCCLPSLAFPLAVASSHRDCLSFHWASSPASVNICFLSNYSTCALEAASLRKFWSHLSLLLFGTSPLAVSMPLLDPQSTTLDATLGPATKVVLQSACCQSVKLLASGGAGSGGRESLRRAGEKHRTAKPQSLVGWKLLYMRAGET